MASVITLVHSFIWVQGQVCILIVPLLPRLCDIFELQLHLVSCRLTEPTKLGLQ